MTNALRDLSWSDDLAGFELDGVSYRVEQLLTDDRAGTDSPDYFRFYKPKAMIDQYACFFDHRPTWSPREIMELGIWRGGSAAFWSQVWSPAALVAIDYEHREDSPALSQFRSNHPDGRSITTHWGVDQTDSAAIETIVTEFLAGGVDLIIDDASHKYRQTLRSFEILFPKLRLGGIYVIEDWSWSLDDEFLEKNPDWQINEPLAPIVADLAELVALRPDVATELEVHPDFVAVVRGPGPIESTLLGQTTSQSRRAVETLRRSLRRRIRSITNR